jgi:DNA-binding MarR family transcriptional regulator
VSDQDALISRIMDTQRRLREQLAGSLSHPLLDLNLTMSQLKVLILLSHLGGASGQELARRTGVGLPTLTGIVDRLVGQHLVTRREDPRDRRVRRLELTPAGAALVDRVLTAGAEHHQQVLQRLDEDALQIVAQAFELILSATSKALIEESNADHDG